MAIFKTQEITWKTLSRSFQAKNSRTLNILETELFAEAINGLSSSTKQNLSIINDACDVNCDRFSNRVATKLNDWPWVNSSIESHHKADENYLIVGSNVSKVSCVTTL